jgi:hypothetical protein
MPNQKKELKGGFLPFLIPLVATLIPTAVDLGMSATARKRQQDEDQRRENELATIQATQEAQRAAVAQQRLDETIMRNQERFRTQPQSRGVIITPQQIAQENALQRQREQAAIQSRSLAASQSQAAAQRQAVSQISEAQQRSLDQMRAASQTATAKQRQFMDQQSAAQQQVLAREYQQQLQRATQGLQQQQQMPAPRVVASRSTAALTSRRGRGADSDVLRFLQTFYGLSLSEAKQVAKNL